MEVVLVLVAIGLVGCFLFIGWFMLKALGVNFQWLKIDAQRYPKRRRKFIWAAAVTIPVCVGLGGLIGAIAAPAHQSALSSSVKGDGFGMAVAYALLILLVFLIGRPSDAPHELAGGKRCPSQS
jgi:hypothetical protein